MTTRTTLATKRNWVTTDVRQSLLSACIKGARFVAFLLRQGRVPVLAGTLIVMFSLALAAAPVNTVCPVTTDEPIDTRFTTMYEGREVGFCCSKCRRQFLADPAKYAASLASAISSASIDTHDSQDLEHEIMSTDSMNHDSMAAGATNHPDTGSASSHDHATDHDQLSGRLITYLGKYHPLIVHFPVALLVTAFLLTAVGFVRKSIAIELLGIRLSYFAAAGAVMAALLGLAAGTGARYPTELAGYFVQHRFLGLTTAALSLIVSFAGYRAETRRSRGWLGTFRFALAIAAILVGITAHWGAMLVYGPDHFAF